MRARAAMQTRLRTEICHRLYLPQAVSRKRVTTIPKMHDRAKITLIPAETFRFACRCTPSLATTPTAPTPNRRELLGGTGSVRHDRLRCHREGDDRRGSTSVSFPQTGVGDAGVFTPTSLQVPVYAYAFVRPCVPLLSPSTICVNATRSRVALAKT